jgi:hypothetical protein
MTKRKMAQREYFDLIGTVKEQMNLAFIAEAHRCGTSGLATGMYSREHIKSIETLRAAGILDGLKLDTNWRTAIDDVCAGRAVYELSDDDIKSIVDAWYRSEF